jgi:hypothetical protein
MLQLMYASSEINWDDGIAKNIRLATFSQGFLNCLPGQLLSKPPS